MKALMMVVLSLGSLSVALAQEAANTPTTSQETSSHSYAGPKAEAEYNRIKGEGIVNGPIAMCVQTASKVERTDGGLQQTECYETSTTSAPQCGGAKPPKYSCTETKSLDGQPLPNIPLGIAL